MRSELFRPTAEGEARVLLLIETFSRGRKVLEGRTKLAKLDFLLRYPAFLRRALEIRGLAVPDDVASEGMDKAEARMVRYRYGPWDPAYYAILGRLIGKGLVVGEPTNRGIGFKVTPRGQAIARQMRGETSWRGIAARLDVLRKYFDLGGTRLKAFIYESFPEVTQATWGQKL